MLLLMELDPDLSVQALWVTQFDEDSIRGLVGEVWRDGNLASTGRPVGVTFCDRRHDPVRWTPSRIGPKYCLAFDFTPAGGATYEVVVRADGRPTARATTTVPGRFEMVSAAAYGDPPGTEGLDATWRPSESAFRYVVGLRQVGICSSNGCDDAAPRGWYQPTVDTTLSTVVPDYRTFTEGPFAIDVYAMDQALFDYLTTGSLEDLFPVPPTSNVIDGFGVVGSWVTRTVVLQP